MVVKVFVLRAPGTNCDIETAFAFERAGGEVSFVQIGELARRKRNLDDCQILVIPGGFTYGDYLGAGRILAGEIKRSLALDFEHFISRGGLVLGICNGFQVLVKAGILPGNNKQSQVAIITFNDSGKFECRWVYLSVNPNSNCVFTSGLEKLYLPVAHGEGKFLAGAKILGDIDTPVFYIDRAGNKVGYPWNPNGSIKNIAGICDRSGRIFGLMPHPERHIEPSQYPRWTREGDQGNAFEIFLNAVRWARAL